MTEYLSSLCHRAEVIVVDGSPEVIFREHGRRWGKLCKHLRPHSDLRYLNGKVNGVLTGLREAGHENVVIADDDVRYSFDNLETVAKLLSLAELVLPQNYFSPLPWHAKWDTARTLLNRALWHDYPGTLGVRRSFLLELGGYNGDVLFENLELIRTVRAAGGTVAHVPNLFVRRLPPTVKGFWAQRVRQAYDDLAQPWRLVTFLLVLPIAARSISSRPWMLGAAAGVPIALAEAGRRRDSGGEVFPAICSLFAPLWILERAACVWAAVGQRVMRGGCRYGEGLISSAASPLWELKRRFPQRNVARRATFKSDRLM